MRRTVTATVLGVLLVACQQATEPAPPRDEPPARPVRPASSTTTTTTPGDGPDPHTDTPAPTDEGAALVAAAFATAAYGAGGDLAARVAPYVTDRLLADYTAPAATYRPTPEAGTMAVVESVTPIAPQASRWRFEVVLTVADTTPEGTGARVAVLVVDVVDTPAGPRVDAAR